MQVGPTGTKSWLLRYRLHGRERWMGLGSVNDFSLDEARERARRARQLIKDGVDPLDARAADRAAQALAAAKAMTFEEATKQYYEARRRVVGIASNTRSSSATRCAITSFKRSVGSPLPISISGGPKK